MIVMGGTRHAEDCLEVIREHFAAAEERHGKLLELMVAVEAQSAVVARAAAEVDRVQNHYDTVVADPLAEMKECTQAERLRVLMEAVEREREERKAVEDARMALVLGKGRLSLVQREALNLATGWMPSGLVDSVHKLALTTKVRRTETSGGQSVLQQIEATETAAEGVEHGGGSKDGGYAGVQSYSRIDDAVWRRYGGVTEAVIESGYIPGYGRVLCFSDGDQRARDMGCGPAG